MICRLKTSVVFAAPSEVTSLTHIQLPDGTFALTWKEPTTPNGVIRLYEVLIEVNGYSVVDTTCL